MYVNAFIHKCILASPNTIIKRGNFLEHTKVNVISSRSKIIGGNHGRPVCILLHLNHSQITTQHGKV